MRHHTKFMAICRIFAELWQFNGFSKWRPSAIVDSLDTNLDHTRRALGGLYCCAKFGWSRYSSFDNMEVLIFCSFGLKTPIHAP